MEHLERSSRFSYVVDEHQISQERGMRLRHPIRVFTLGGLGIDGEKFIRFMLPFFSTLHMDPYDGKRNKIAFLKTRFPEAHVRLDCFLADYYANNADIEEIWDLLLHLKPEDRHEFDRIGMTARRKRAVAKLILIRRYGAWEIKRTVAPIFTQSVSTHDARAIGRRFREVSPRVTEYADMHRLVYGVADMVHEVRPEAIQLQITLHFMFVFADALSEGDNSPEGIHRDGTDYIVSALVIERAGILGGESVVYARDRKTEYLRYTLQPGEGLFQDDRHYWHYVTPIQEDAAVPSDYGNRSIIGFDIKILNE